MAQAQTKTVVDRSHLYDVLQLVGALLLAVATFVTWLATKTDLELPSRIAVLICAVFVGVVTLLKSRNASAVKQKDAAEKQDLAKQLDAERVRTMATMHGGFKPAALLVQTMAGNSQEQRRSTLGTTTAALLATWPKLVKADSVRISYFRLDNLDDIPAASDESPSTNRILKAFPFIGEKNRLDRPRETFTEGESRDNAIWSVLDTGTPLFVEDLATTKQPGIDLDRERIYKTFITVAVRTDQVPFGVLSANATSVGDLTELDLRMIEVLAHLLATAEALALGTTMTNRLQQRNSVRSPAQPDGEGVS